jgi:hypothetical protein
MDLETISFIEFMWEEESKFKKSLSEKELDDYEKGIALIKLKPFLKKWILKHFGKYYLDNKYAMIKQHKEKLDFYYEMIKNTQY